MSLHRASRLAALAAVIASSAHAADGLTERSALNVAKRSFKKECTSETPCSFTAMREGNSWLVHVGFTKRDAMNGRPYPYVGGTASLLIDRGGKVVKRSDDRR